MRGFGDPQQKYDELKHSRFFRALTAKAPILATWDDHDYGADDSGGSWPTKIESQREFLDWIEAPPESPLRGRDADGTPQVALRFTLGDLAATG